MELVYCCRVTITLCLFGFLCSVQSNPTNPTTKNYLQNGEPLAPRETHEDGPPDNYGSVAYCEAYCDVYGYYQPGKWCVSEDSSVEVYCCGTEFTRYCCGDPSKDVGDMYPEAKKCPNSSWRYYQWRVIVGLLGTLVVMLLLAACCYYCCGGTRVHYGTPRGGFFTFRRQTHPDDETLPTEDTTFDPESPYAFQPPDYSLPKDPPKYNDVVSGVDNSAFDNRETNATPDVVNPPSSNSTDSLPPEEPASAHAETPPPVYEELDSNNSEIATSGNQGLATVHMASSSGVISGSNTSLTGHATPQHNVDTLTSVESNPPPPYEQTPTLTAGREGGGQDSNNNNNGVQNESAN